MSGTTHERSWSVGDQEYFQFMFAEGYTPSWNEAEERSDFDWPISVSEPQCQLERNPLVSQPPLQQIPWTDVMDISTYTTFGHSNHGYHSPLIDGSGFATSSSATSTTMIPPVSQGQPYFQTAPAPTPQPSIPDALPISKHTFITQPQPCIAPQSTSSQSIPGVTNSPHTAARQLRPPSPRTQEMSRYGTRNMDGSWSCRYDRCNSQIRFRRKCDLRKHHLRHLTRYYCSHSECDEAEGRGNGFSSKKDCTRHEQKHDPKIQCDWTGCKRLFSRKDNMRDHMNRMHLRPRPRRRATTAD